MGGSRSRTQSSRCPVSQDCGVPASVDLAGAEIELVSQVVRETRLRKALRDYLSEHEERNGWLDYVVIDCPPSLGLLTLNALVAVDEVLIPLQSEYYALEGLSHLLGTVGLIQGAPQSDLQITGILLTMYDGRTKLAPQVAAEVRGHFPSGSWTSQSREPSASARRRRTARLSCKVRCPSSPRLPQSPRGSSPAHRPSHRATRDDRVVHELVPR